ncbi:DUF3413 domain-containing protein [Alteromonas sp. ASW11-130]|uniref:DUF3413 domain-containing protein n=1 Tax=Alteromonas sp. ASW11-130 TaxID=3015775 RepID=UPI00224283AA|nr:DUF3413 domain-containing protein [Alteromonas sp. ASW11-130]MCW8092221.1 DUF3413 domain-containing protein [Alteromonas sp. ASW11-130]
MILAESPRRQRVTKLVSWGHWFAFVNIFLALIIASVFIFSSPSPNSAIGTLYLLSNWFGHIGFLTFAGFVIFILPLCYLATNPKIIKAAASIIAAIGLALLAFDALLYNRTGFHLNFSSTDLLRSEAQTQISQFGFQQWGYLLLLFIIWLGFQLLLANAIWKRMDRFQEKKIGLPVTTFFVLCFVSSHAVHVWADAELYQPIIKQDNMFPLSYPATAKTTMSRYGLLDLETYEERKQLQFSSDIHQIVYPAEPVYCAIDNNRSMYLIVQTDNGKELDTSGLNLTKTDNYFTNASSLDALIMSTLFGVPEIYFESLTKERPILMELPEALGMPVAIHIDESLPTSMLNDYKQPIENSRAGLHIAFLPAAKINTFIEQEEIDAQNNGLIIATGFESEAGAQRGSLLTNLDVKAEAISTEDLAPTILNSLGCNAPSQFYSTGQDFTNPQRNWLVSTSGERVVVIHENQRIEVLSNGSYEITNIDNGNRSNASLNVDLLSRAIKQLTRFSRPN